MEEEVKKMMTIPSNGGDLMYVSSIFGDFLSLGSLLKEGIDVFSS